MTARRAEHARRVASSVGAEHDYASSFQILASNASAWSPQQWARTTLEGAPRMLRWFVLIGWKAVLRLQLGPSGSPDHLLGWAIQTTTPEAITLEARSGLLTAHKVLLVDEHRITLTTFVDFHRVWGRVDWSVIAPVHHRLEPLLLTSAASMKRWPRAPHEEEL